MLAIEAERAGGPEVLTAVHVPVPAPGPGEVLIWHHAIGVNFIDTYHRSGLYPAPLPTTLGQEASGVVKAVGPGVTRFGVGDRVAYAGRMGAYAQANLVPEDRIVDLPDGVSFEVAAAALLKGMTAEFLVRRCRPIKAGETILVHAAAGGVGAILVQWAKTLGATVIATVGSAHKAAMVRSLGCDLVILYRQEDVAARVREITRGAGVAAAYDGVGKDTFEGTLASLGRRGTFVSFGNASGPAPAVEPLRLSRAGSLFFTRPTLFDYIATPQELRQSAGALFSEIAAGRLRIEIGQRFPLAEARRAHEALESRATSGATLLIP
ncbi:MAG TPA: quinone oxidoreductase [Caulobacteraceae bacterium]